MADVDVPGLGPVKKQYVIIGGAAVAGIVAYAWWKAGTAPDEPVEEYPADTGDISEPTDGYVNPAPGGSTVVGDPQDPDTLPPTTNAQWTMRAVAALEAVGVDVGAASLALARYLGRQSLSPVQVDMVRQALALVGPVPQGTYNIITTPAPPVTPGRPNPPTTTPKPTPKPPTPKPPTTTTKRFPARWKSVIVLPGDNYGKIANRHKLKISGTDLLSYQFSAQAGRPESTKAALRKRVPKDRIFPGGTVVLPYPK